MPFHRMRVRSPSSLLLRGNGNIVRDTGNGSFFAVAGVIKATFEGITFENFSHSTAGPEVRLATGMLPSMLILRHSPPVEHNGTRVQRSCEITARVSY